MKKKSFLNYTLVIIIIIATLILLFTLILVIIKLCCPKQETLPDNYVTYVIDGDTFEIATGQRVRLICIDAPESDKEDYLGAKEFLEDLILDKVVRLEKDVSETDKYGRLLRYVYVNISEEEIFVNLELVKQGYASVWRYEPDVKRCDEIEK